MDETRSIGRRSLLISSKRMTEVPYAQANQRTDRRRERERGNMRLSLCRRNRLNRNSRTRRIMLREREKRSMLGFIFFASQSHAQEPHMRHPHDHVYVSRTMAKEANRSQNDNRDEERRTGATKERVEEREYDDVYMSSFPITVSMNLCMP